MSASATTHPAILRAALHNSMLRGGTYNLEEKAALASRCGYTGLDCSIADLQRHGGGDPMAARDCFARHGVEPAMLNGVLSASVIAADEEWEASLRQVTERARLAASVGATHSGAVLWHRAFEPKETLWPKMVQRLRQVDRALDGTGVRMSLKYLGVCTSRLERPYAFVQSLRETLLLLADVQPKNLGLTIDTYHWYAAGDTVEEIRKLPAGWLVAIHASDARAVPREQLQDQERLLPGEGVIPLAELFQAAEEIALAGFVGLEVLGPRVADLDAESYARAGITALRRVYPRFAGGER